MEDKSNKHKSIFVTKPALPALDEYIPYLQEIWDKRVLTNNGPFHKQLEEELADFLGVSYLSLFANGTLALVTALQSLDISGEVITTPYSFVATSHSLWWNNITPVFVDIDPLTCNLDPSKIEEAITDKTSAILPVHVYGNPCDIEEINRIADRNKLKVIYDAAHAFGVNYGGRSILNYGDLSILSFHATKVFNTMEGGAIVCNSLEQKKKIDYLKNFGFASETEIIIPGINSKMNEMQAALGLLQMKHHKVNVEAREERALFYEKELSGIPGIDLFMVKKETEQYNYPYFPIFIKAKDYGKSRDELYFHLKEKDIHGRRYFYPLISTFPTYATLPSSRRENLLNASRVSEEVICLPLYPDLDLEDVARISKLIRNFAG